MARQNTFHGCTLITLFCTFEMLIAQTPSDYICGIVNQPRIVGGVSVDYYKYPWFAQLVSYEPEEISVCGGSLITANHILTAAHCFEGHEESPASAFKVVLGVFDNCNLEEDKDRKVFEIKSVVIHEDYDGFNNANDIAIIFLSSSANEFEPVCLPTKNASLPHSSTIIGFGRYDFSNRTKVCKLQEARVRVYSSAQCRRFREPFNDFDLPGAICAGYPQGRIDSCLGDSGGPLIANRNFINTIRGIVSYGLSCAEKGWPGVYTNVAYYIDWIYNYVGFVDHE